MKRLDPSLFSKIKLLTISIVVGTLLLTYSCKNSNKNTTRIEAKKELVLELHDDLMLDLPEIKRITKIIEMRLGDSTLVGISLQSSNIALINLTKADKEMWDWMHQFDISYQHENDSLILRYFDDQYNYLLLVHLNIDSAIQVGKNMIANYEHAQ